MKKEDKRKIAIKILNRLPLMQIVKLIGYSMGTDVKFKKDSMTIELTVYGLDNPTKRKEV